MEQLNFNALLNRSSIVNSITQLLQHFEANKADVSFKRGIYIYGAPGSGKTELVMRLLKELNYDVIKYDAGDIRNKPIIDAITKHNMADKSVVSLFHKKAKPIAIVMDEIDGMNNGDKGGINSLIKLIRPKKTKKQRLEEVTLNPIICISSYHVDKKIKELMKVCHSFEVETPSAQCMSDLIKQLMPDLDMVLVDNMLNYLQGDLRKLTAVYKIYCNHYSLLKNELIQNIFKPKAFNEDTKDITKKLLSQFVGIEEHLTIMNETDRTIVGLLWHENIIDIIAKCPKTVSIPFYTKVLDNICFADYIDRVTFQKQIWQFNEMSSLIKTMHCNKMFHDTFAFDTKVDAHANAHANANANANANAHAIMSSKAKSGLGHVNPINATDVRFTKVLTKYSTEYNNSLFIQELCQQLGLDKKDMFAFFLSLKQTHTDDEIYGLFEMYDIGKLDINRIYRFLDKYINKDCKVGGEDHVYVEEENEATYE